MTKKKKRKEKYSNNLFKIIAYLVALIIVFTIAPNYEDNYGYVKNKINIILDNNNITKSLMHDLYITDKKVIYISIEDIRNYFDTSITYSEEDNKIVTNHGDKVVELPLNKNIIKINKREEDVLTGAKVKDGIYYVPITEMGKIYEIDIEYVEDNKILVLDSLTKKLVKADISKKCSVKYKTTSFSRTMDKLKKAEKVIVIENLKNNWTKIRTKSGIIGYVKTNILQNEIYVREDLNL